MTSNIATEAKVDVVVIGGGVTGLVTATRLAKKGERVVLCEQATVVGGLSARHEFHPGYAVPGIVHDAATFRSAVVDELGLTEHGLARRDPVDIVVPRPDGTRVVLPRRSGRLPQGVGDDDRQAWSDWQAFLDRVRPFVRKLIDGPPPPLDASGPKLLMAALPRAVALRRLGVETMSELLALLPMSVADALDDRFTSDALKVAMAWPGLEASMFGPRSAGGMTPLLFDACLRDQEIEGGPAALVAALERAASSAGVDIRTGVEVTRIDVEDKRRRASIRRDGRRVAGEVVAGGRATGVRLADGTRIAAALVVSTVDPKKTFLDLLVASRVPSELTRDIERFRMRGTTAKVHLALNTLPSVAGSNENLSQTTSPPEAFRIADDLDDIERAFDAVKYGEFSQRPCLDVRIPTLSDSSLAPGGHHVVSILAQYAPYHLEAPWTDEAKEEFGRRALDRFETVCPGVTGHVVAGEVLSPLDLELRFGVTEGHLLHGEPALDQLLSLRPNATCASGKTPIDGLRLG